jgi:hypothetical protein
MDPTCHCSKDPLFVNFPLPVTKTMSIIYALENSVVDPYSFFPDPDPEFDVGDQYRTDPDPNPIRIQGLNDQKLKKNYN